MKSQFIFAIPFLFVLQIAIAGPEKNQAYLTQPQDQSAFAFTADNSAWFSNPGLVVSHDQLGSHLNAGPGVGFGKLTSQQTKEQAFIAFSKEDSVWASPQDDVFSAANSAFAAGNDLFVDHLKAGPGAGVGSPVGAFSSFSDVNSAASFIWAEAGRAAAQPTESISNEEIRLDLKSGYTSDSSGFGSIGTYNDAIRAMESFDSISQYMRHMSGNAQEAAAQGFMKAAIFADEPAPGSLKVLEMTAEQILLEMWTGSDYSQFTSHPDDFSDEELEALYNSWETGSDISLDQ